MEIQLEFNFNVSFSTILARKSRYRKSIFLSETEMKITHRFFFLKIYKTHKMKRNKK